MIRLSQLKQKEIIKLYNGQRIGYIFDVDIHPETGQINHFYVHNQQEKGSFFQKADEKIIRWEQIITIGVDIILISDPDGTQKKLP